MPLARGCVVLALEFRAIPSYAHAIMTRILLSLLLTLSLAFTSLTMAQARGAAAATGQMVICSGLGTTIVNVDAEGQPTRPPHLCPDCLIVLAPDGADAPLKLPHRTQPARFVEQLSDRAPSPVKGLTPPSRAPPCDV